MASHSSATAREHTLKRNTPINSTPTDTQTIENNGSRQLLETLVEMICGGGDDPGTRSAALLVLMATVQDADDPKSLAHAAKHLAFIQCGEFNAFGIVDAQVAMLGRELMPNHSLSS